MAQGEFLVHSTCTFTLLCLGLNQQLNVHVYKEDSYRVLNAIISCV